MNKSYSLVSPSLFIQEDAYNAKVASMQSNPDEFPDIFLKINDGDFTNWFIHVTKMSLVEVSKKESRIQCEYAVAHVPKGITDADIEKMKPKLAPVLDAVLLDIMKESTDLLRG